MLQAKASLDFCYSPAGLGPLHLASQELVDLEVAEFLIKKGANINAMTAGNGSTPLHLAAAQGSLPMVEMLLSRGGAKSLDILDSKGRSPFFVACAAGASGCASLLLEKGGQKRIGIRDERGNSPLIATVKEGNKEIFDLLLSKQHYRNGTLDEADIDGRTALHWAASRGQSEMAERLLQAKASPDVITVEDGWTPLHSAARAGKIETGKVLFHNGGQAGLVDLLSKPKPQPDLQLPEGYQAIPGANKIHGKKNETPKGVTAVELARRHNHTSFAEEMTSLREAWMLENERLLLMDEAEEEKRGHINPRPPHRFQFFI